MSVDVSPDGRTILFDHLGDLFTVPISGGRTRRLTRGMAIDIQPRFSPDGRRIVFLSDRSGGAAVWVMDTTGRNAARISATSHSWSHEFATPAWAPDSRSVVVAHNTNFAPGRILRLQPDGAGEPIVIAQASAQPDGKIARVFHPAFSPDGTQLYFNYEYAAGIGENRASSVGNYHIARVDLGTGTIVNLPRTLGGALQPLPTPDGRGLAYATRAEAQSTGIRLHDLSIESGRWITRQAQLDAQEFYSINGLMPGMALTRDGRTMLLSRAGGIWKVDVASGAQTQVPFQVDVDLELAALSRFNYPIDDDRVVVRGPTSPRVSPDGSRIAFSAVGRLWILGRDGADPRALTPAEANADQVAWSPDGRWIAFTSWNPASGAGHIWRIASDGSGPATRLTEAEGAYSELAFAPGGVRLLFRQRMWPRPTAGINVDGLAARDRQSIWSMSPAGGERRRIAELQSSYPEQASMAQPYEASGGLHVAGPDRRIFFREDYAFKSMTIDGGDVRPESMAGNVRVSPRGDRALKTVQERVDLVRFPASAEPGADSGAIRLPLLRDLAWAPDGTRFYGFDGMRMFTYDVAELERLGAAYRPDVFEFRLDIAAARPQGSILLRGGRIITMDGDRVIERGDLLVTGNRIVVVGAAGTVAAPDGAEVVDTTGMTILPGWIDVHAHPHGDRNNRYSADLTNLAYGITTLRDPSPGDVHLSRSADLDTGHTIGPRLYSTGTALLGMYRTCLDEVDAIVGRHALVWNTETLKQYTAGNRHIRQRVVAAARRVGLTPTNEGVDFAQDLSMIIDGYAGIEHFIRATPLHDDMIQLLARSGTTWTPTLIDSGDFSPRNYASYLASRHAVDREERLRRFQPLHFRSTWMADNLMVRPDDRYHTPRIAADVARIVAAGGRIGVGSHGVIQGIGVHFELWALASGGMPLHDVLRAGTIFGAEAIGHGRDLGSIEPGKLADLQILGANPLENIRNSLSTRYVMRGGFLYEAGSLDQLWPEQRRLPEHWWQRDD